MLISSFSAPLEGRLNIEARDEAYARAHIGLVKKNFDIATARFCWHGHMGYKINILKVRRSTLTTERKVIGA